MEVFTILNNMLDIVAGIGLQAIAILGNMLMEFANTEAGQELGLESSSSTVTADQLRAMHADVLVKILFVVVLYKKFMSSKNGKALKGKIAAVTKDNR